MATNNGICRTICAFCIAVITIQEAQCLRSKTTKYEPNWKSIDSRPLPAWYDEVKVGIFIVWGIYSVPSFGNEWFWDFWKSGQKPYVEFMEKNYRPGFTYSDFAADFTAEMFDPKQWADITEASGAK